MPIDPRYLNIIDQCEKRIDELNPWETTFILGEEGNPKKRSIRERGYLSHKQKQKLDGIVAQRFENRKHDKNDVIMKFGDVNAERTDEGWVITIKGRQIGKGMCRAEAPIITSWLHGALANIIQLEADVFEKYLTKEEPPDTAERVSENTEEDEF